MKKLTFISLITLLTLIPLSLPGLAKKPLCQTVASCSKIIQKNPKNAEAYYYRGFAYSTLNNPMEEIKNYNKAIQLNPKYAWAYYSRAMARWTIGDNTGALADAEKAKELDLAQNNMEGYQRALKLLERMKTP